MEKYQKYEYKLLFLGSSGCGAKTSLINKFVRNKYDEYFFFRAHLESIFIQAKLGIIKLNLWDAEGGQGSYASVSKIFIKASDCIILG